MRRCATALLLTLILLSGCQTVKNERQDTYDPVAAVAYSYEYSTKRNPEYADFDSNCTNYISQCLVAGGKSMDEAVQPKSNVRITYHNQKTKWFSCFIETVPERWKEFSVSTSFCRTEAFVEYWTKQRGMSLSIYSNEMSGLISLYNRAEAGDIVILYDAKDKIVHLCLISVRADDRLLLNANTIDYCDHNILKISALEYPHIGLIEME